jgi:hypothetical protein
VNCAVTNKVWPAADWSESYFGGFFRGIAIIHGAPLGCARAYFYSFRLPEYQSVKVDISV